MGEAAAWRVLAASVSGANHLRQARSCEDAFSHSTEVEPSILIAAVADGAGSASHGAIGAKIASETVVASLRRALSKSRPDTEDGWLDTLARSVAEARGALERELSNPPDFTNPPEVPPVNMDEEGPKILRDLATTLLAVVVVDGWVAWAHTGDGALVAFNEADDILAVSWPENGPYLDETVFLTSEKFDEATVRKAVPQNDVASVALITDGLEVIALDFRNKAPFLPFFRAMLGYTRRPEASAAALEAFLGSDDVNGKTDDDKTLLIAVRS